MSARGGRDQRCILDCVRLGRVLPQAETSSTSAETQTTSASLSGLHYTKLVIGTGVPLDLHDEAQVAAQADCQAKRVVISVFALRGATSRSFTLPIGKRSTEAQLLTSSHRHKSHPLVALLRFFLFFSR